MILSKICRKTNKSGRDTNTATLYFEGGKSVEVMAPSLPEGCDISLEGGYVGKIHSLPCGGEEELAQAREDLRFFNMVCDIMSYEDYVYIVANDNSAARHYESDPFGFLTGTKRERDGEPFADFSKVDSKFVASTFEERLTEYRYGAEYVLRRNEKEGNTLMFFADFKREFFKLFPEYEESIELDGEVIDASLELLMKDSLRFPTVVCDVICGKLAIALRDTKKDEDAIKDAVVNYKKAASPYSKVRTDYCQGLCDEQMEAVKVALLSNGRISVITGGPGVGKTTVIRELVKRTQEAYPDIDVRLLAPTGKASSRIAEVMGDLLDKGHISTVHKFVGYGQNFLSSERKAALYNAGLVIIDEASMMDARIFGNLLGKMNISTCKVVLVGDADQLPSVECGNLLADLISAGVPTAYLEINHRNAGNISENAKRILKGDPFLLEGSDFEIDRCSENISWVGVGLDAGIGDLSHHVVFSPYKKERQGGCVSHINRIAQESRVKRDQNGGVQGYSVKLKGFSVGDRVVFVKNNYKAGYFNGECGIVTRVSSSGGYIEVKRDGYDSEIGVDRLDELELAYALSVHKSQGSEYDSVEICLPRDSKFVTRRMLYTAVTRAKGKVTIHATDETIRRAVMNNSDRVRLTFLSMYVRSMAM